MEYVFYTYLTIGFLIGIWRISKVTAEESSAMASIGCVGIMILWPLYLIYKMIKKNKESNP